MKANIIIALGFILFFSNCHIEKRKYRSGFYVQFNKNHTFVLASENQCSTDKNALTDKNILDTSDTELPKQISKSPSNREQFSDTEHDTEVNKANNDEKITNPIYKGNAVIKNDDNSTQDDSPEESKYTRNSWVYLILLSVLLFFPIYWSFALTFGYPFIKSIIYFLPFLFLDYLLFHRKIKSNKNKKLHWLSIVSITLLLLTVFVQTKYVFSIAVITYALPFLLGTFLLSLIAYFVIKSNKEKYKYDLFMKYALVISTTILLTLFFQFYIFY